MNAARLLAHAGGFGWDEALFLLLPVVVLLVLARQAKRKAAEDDEPAESTDHPSSEG